MTDLRAPARLFYTSETALPRRERSQNSCWQSSRLLTRKPNKYCADVKFFTSSLVNPDRDPGIGPPLAVTSSQRFLLAGTCTQHSVPDSFTEG